MKIYILTRSPFKEQELSKYFNNIGLPTTHLTHISQTNDLNEDYLLVTEQTRLLSKQTGLKANLDTFEEVIHYSEIVLLINTENQKETKTYQSKIDGFIFPHLKSGRQDIYNWDDIFVSAKTMKSYQHMKDNGIKNSARDIAFSHMIEDLPAIFKFDSKINLNFNPVPQDEVISFEPIISDLFVTNQYYKLAYENEVFKNLMDYIINDGVFVRRASNRKQKNYWLPGLNAGIPLTPKKDELHELTFMFHDMMHFLFPDLIVTSDTKESKHKYFISRMISEAFTLVLADILFISILKDNGVEYDYTKRKIYPLFDNIKFEISKNNLPKIKELLWANTKFALMGDESIKTLVNNDEAFEIYKSKYQKIFQEDYIWTVHNYKNIAKNHSKNKEWIKIVQESCGNILISSEEFCSDFEMDSEFEKQVHVIFEHMFKKIEDIILQPVENGDKTYKNRATKRYMAGQMFIFFKFDTLYNDLFLNQITHLLKSNADVKIIKNVYEIYLDKLLDDNFITKYEAENYKNIYPFFEPFYVFYDKNKNETFKETLDTLFKE